MGDQKNYKLFNYCKLFKIINVLFICILNVYMLFLFLRFISVINITVINDLFWNVWPLCSFGILYLYVWLSVYVVFNRCAVTTEEAGQWCGDLKQLLLQLWETNSAARVHHSSERLTAMRTPHGRRHADVTVTC